MMELVIRIKLDADPNDLGNPVKVARQVIPQSTFVKGFTAEWGEENPQWETQPWRDW